MGCIKKLKNEIPLLDINVSYFNLVHFDVPHCPPSITEATSKLQYPYGSHTPPMSPCKHVSPHFFPSQPCTAHGLYSGLVQKPFLSQMPSEHGVPHSLPLHSLTTRTDLTRSSIKKK